VPSGYAGVMSRTTVWVVGIIALAAAAVLGQAGYAVYQKRVQQKQVAALVGDSTEKLRQALGAKVTPALVSALEANLQATKAPRLPELADAAEHYIIGAREIARRRVVTTELERRAAASRAALAGHMSHASRRNSGWLRDALSLKQRVEREHYDLGIALKALDELLYTLPESEKRLAPHVDQALLLDLKVADAARRQAQADAERAQEELTRVRRFVN
jgi:hypothetical protein